MLRMDVNISVLLFLFGLSYGLVNGICPSSCSCSNRSAGSFVECFSRSLKHIPDLPHDTYYLDLTYNKITEIDIQFCKEMPQLQGLYVYNNLISGMQENTFEDCENLTIISMFNNRISTIESFTFANLLRLQTISLHGNIISHIEEHAFENLTSLIMLDLSGNPLNCECSIFQFWSWLMERAFLGTTAKCSNGTLFKSLQSAALETCHPDNCPQCFNGGKCVAMGYTLICECIGQWTGKFCQESQCSSYDCGFGDCYIEPVNGTAQCLCGDRYVNYCPDCLLSVRERKKHGPSAGMFEWFRNIP